jgi:hypothetical protein
MTPQNILGLVMIPVIAVGLYFVAPRSHRALGHFWERRCEGRAWRRTFPSAPKEDIRAFLALFMNAFALPSRRMLRFAPTDRVLEIYRAVSPRGWPDAMELETLDEELQRVYGFPLRDVWKETLTLGELFARVRSRVA